MSLMTYPPTELSVLVISNFNNDSHTSKSNVLQRCEKDLELVYMLYRNETIGN